MAGSGVQQLGRSDLARPGSGGQDQSGQLRARQDGRIAAAPFFIAAWAIWEARLDRLDAFVMNVMKESEE